MTALIPNDPDGGSRFTAVQRRPPQRVLVALAPLLVGAMALLVTSCFHPTEKYLVDMSPASGTNIWPAEGPAKVNGVTYFHSLHQFSCCGSRLQTAYDLSRRWTRFRSVIGVRDDSSPKMEVWAEVWADGRRLWAGGTRLGQPQFIDVNVANALRLELRWVTNPEGADEVVWGDARVS